MIDSCFHDWELWTIDKTPSQCKFTFGAVMHAVYRCVKCQRKRPVTIVIGEVIK